MLIAFVRPNMVTFSVYCLQQSLRSCFQRTPTSNSLSLTSNMHQQTPVVSNSQIISRNGVTITMIQQSLMAATPKYTQLQRNNVPSSEPTSTTDLNSPHLQAPHLKLCPAQGQAALESQHSCLIPELQQVQAIIRRRRKGE